MDDFHLWRGEIITMKKRIATLLTAGVLLLTPFGAQAATPVGYKTPVKVQIQNASNYSVYVKGYYKLKNLSSGAEKFLQPNMSVSVSKGTSGVSIAANTIKETSVNGFTLTELQGGVKISTFSNDTPIRSGASNSYEVKATGKSGEAVEYLGEFTNSSGEKWLNVKNAEGITGWAPRATTFLPQEAPALSLITVNSRNYRGSLDILPNSSNVKAINNLDIESYLKGVVPNEMPASWHKEALKAQAITARSYAANTGIMQATTASQVYRGYDSEESRATTAVNETAGKYVMYNGKPIQTFFFSTSGGRTANVSDVWNSSQASFPYLVSVESPDEKSSYNSWSQAFSSRTLLTNFGYGPNVVLFDIQLAMPGQNGEVRGATLVTSEGTKSFTGNELDMRKYFRSGESLLRSNWFDLSANKTYSVQTAAGQQSQFSVLGQGVQLASGSSTVSGSTVAVQTNAGIISQSSDPASIVANGKGWGHRIGMSQYGAKAYAEKGWTAEQIVTHYFKGTTISAK
jgi:stage II sporulation protein D